MSDSYNHIFKQSVNAFDNTLISGGSSGGEGALIGCRGSIVGIGTDIGGSVRIPANLQGLYGLSPTTGRVPMDKSGQRSYVVPPVAGPLAHDLSTLETFMDALASVGKPWEYEPFAPPLPWRREMAAMPDRPLKIGYFVDDGFCRCQPPLELAVVKAVEALKAAGHEVVPWSTDLHAEGDRLWLKAVLAGGGKAYRAEAERGGEPTIPGMLTGELEDELDLDQGYAVSRRRRAWTFPLAQRRLLTPSSCTERFARTNTPTSGASTRPVWMPSSSPRNPTWRTNPAPGSRPRATSATPRSGTSWIGPG